MVGRSLLHYRVLSLLGRGGMGEVYRAHDDILDRDVAIKVLPTDVCADATRLARFEREARTLAALNHPNVAVIHGVAHDEDVRGLVMELVDGESLSARLQRGAIALDEAMRIADAVAAGLEAAHDKGIIHRDLKPANISLTPNGGVKVLDFGLAKCLRDEAEGTQAQTDAGTRQGTVLGTPAYMSPEQARGLAVDKRTDIWAFGCVLYEMLAGRVAFGGSTWADTISSVLERDPDWAAVPATVPAPLLRLMKRCLERDLSRRMRDIADVRIAIEEVRLLPSEMTGIKAPRSSQHVVAWAATALMLGVATVAIWFAIQRDSPTAIGGSQPVARAAVTLPADALLAIGRTDGMGFNSPLIAISRDGSHLAYIGMQDGISKVFVRQIAGGEFHAVSGTEGAIHAFFAPGGRMLGFLTRDKVRRASLDGGDAITLADAREPREGWWISPDLVYFTSDQGNTLSRVSADGTGRPEEIVGLPVWRRFDSWNMTISDVVHDGRTALFTKRSTGIVSDYAEVMALSLETFEARPLIRAGYAARYVEPGLLLFARAGQLMSVAVDPETLAPHAEPAALQAEIAVESFFGVAQVAASKDFLITVPGSDRSHGSFAWIDRHGRVEPLGVPPRPYGAFDLSPDGKRVAAHVGDVTDYIWVLDVARREGRKLAYKSSAGWPVWHPASNALLFRGIHGRVTNTYVIRSVDSDTPPQEVMSPRAITTVAWAPDAKSFAVRFQNLLGYEAADRTRIGKAVSGVFPSFSPDGRWLAYASTESGRAEIWVMSYPDGTGQRQITTEGGTEPIWCPCGELFFRSGNDRWFSVKTISGATDISWDPARLAFETEIVDTPGISYDVSADGQRLLVIKRSEPDVRDRIDLSINWRAQLPSNTRQ